MSAFLANHYAAIGLVFGYILLAVFQRMPPPGSGISAYEWTYDVVQALLNSPAVRKFQDRFDKSQNSPKGTP